MKTKVNKDGFVWLIVNKRQAKLIFINDIANVYRLFDDGSVSIVNFLEDFCIDGTYGIPIENLRELTKQWKDSKKLY